jgi:hypothetical protein
VPRAGRYELRVTYSPYWRTRRGCVARSADGMTALTVRRPGTVVMRFAVTAARAVETLEGETGRCVSAVSAR